MTAESRSADSGKAFRNGVDFRQMKYIPGNKRCRLTRPMAGGRTGAIVRLPAENPNPVLRVSGDGMLLYANPAAASLLDHWGCHLEERIPAAVLSEVTRSFANGERLQLEVPLGERILLAVLAPFPPKGYVNFYFTDITERKRVEDELRSLLERLDTLVRERTAEIESKNSLLVVEINERRRAEEDTQKYARRLIELEEGMRRRLAAELHDEFGRDLTALGLNFTIISNSLSPESREKLGERVEDTAALIEELGRNVRHIMFMLRPPVLDDFGLAAALRWHAELFGKRTGIWVDVQADEDAPRLPEQTETALFRIAQEALTNVSKHAAATRVTVELSRGGGALEMSILDNGSGFDPKRVSHPGAGWGLTIMRERAEAVGARFELRSQQGRGTVVRVTLQGGR